MSHLRSRHFTTFSFASHSARTFLVMITQDRSGGRAAGSPISRPRCKMSVQGVRKAPEELANVGHLHYSHISVECFLDAEKHILEALQRYYKSSKHVINCCICGKQPAASYFRNQLLIKVLYLIIFLEEWPFLPVQCTGPTTCTAHCELFRSLAAESSKHVMSKCDAKVSLQRTGPTDSSFRSSESWKKKWQQTNAPKSIFKKISTYPTYNSNRNLKRRTTWETVYLLFFMFDDFGRQPSNIKSSCHLPHPIDPEMWGEWPHGIEFRWDTKSPNFFLSFQAFQAFHPMRSRALGLKVR